jgi:hypothetical protein
MAHPMHDSVVGLVQKAMTLMDRLLRGQVDIEGYSGQLKALDVDSVLVAHEPEFKEDAGLVYYLDALMLLSSLQHELAFQVAEYGSNVALEDMRNLEELLKKFSRT